jgi:hypothetical protein
VDEAVVPERSSRVQISLVSGGNRNRGTGENDALQVRMREAEQFYKQW